MIGSKTMKARFLALSLLAGMALMSTACEPISGGGEGKTVTFTASSKGHVGTKAAYSGAITNNYERINWEEGDILRVYSPQLKSRPLSPGDDPEDYDNFSDYVVKSASNSGSVSTATVENRYGNGLYWPDNFTGTADFYAIYPATACRGDFWVFPVTVPATQTLEWNGNTAQPKSDIFMLARTTGVSKNSRVDLDFVPVLTAFEIHLKCDQEVTDVKNLTGLSLQSADSPTETGNPGAVAGTCLFNLQNGNVSFESPTSSVSVDLTGKTISKDQEIVFTLFALPHNLTNMSLSVSYLDGTETVTRTFALDYSNGTPVTFVSGKKYIMKGIAMKDVWTFSVDLGLEVVDWMVGGTNTIDYSDAVTTTAFNFSSSEYQNVGVTIDNENWNITFDLTNPNTVLYISFTISTPLGANWSVQMDDPLEYFTLHAMNDGLPQAPTGTVGDNEGKIVLRIKPNFANIPAERASDYSMILHTFVEVGDKAHNIDSETQLFDQYHKFADFIIKANEL